MIALFHGANGLGEHKVRPYKQKIKIQATGLRSPTGDTRRGEFIPPNHNKGIKLAVSRRSRDRCRRFDTELPMA